MPILIVIFIVIGAFLTGSGMMNPQVESVPTEEIPVETPSPSPSSTPTPTPIPQVKINQVAPTPYDPIVECVSEWEKQKGITRKVKKSACDSYIDCQMGGGALARVPSKEYCEEVQRLIAEKKQNQLVNCQTQSGWKRMSQDDCTKAQNAWGNQILDNAKQQEQTNQEIINAFRSIENEIWQATNLDQLDNIRERLRQLPQAPDPSIQDYIGTLIRLIEARIKILQQQ